jgi:transcriptional/translational regulatory protein YebC/TACO1
MEVRDLLENLGYEIRSAEIEMVPKTTQKLEKKDSEMVLELLDALEDNDDVNKLYTNFDFA